MNANPHMSRLSGTAMVLAAGEGRRMRPLTLTKPKPLQQVGGRTMLDLALDKLKECGIGRVVVNAHYLADQIAAHVAARWDMEIILSREDELLDTGGGVKNALPHLGDKPFFVLNADLPWMDGGEPSLSAMARIWDAARMDVLLLMMQTRKARGFGPDGDYVLSAEGRARRKNVLPPRPFVMLSAQILKPEMVAAEPARVFSNSVLWDRAEAAGRLQGLEHQGTCYHVGTPEDLVAANDLLARGVGWAVP